jgi:hypothetical protein
MVLFLTSVDLSPGTTPGLFLSAVAGMAPKRERTIGLRETIFRDLFRWWWLPDNLALQQR